MLQSVNSKKGCQTKVDKVGVLLQEFDFKVKDRIGCENRVAGHLSRLEGKAYEEPEVDINNSFPDEKVIATTLHKPL